MNHKEAITMANHSSEREENHSHDGHRSERTRAAQGFGTKPQRDDTSRRSLRVLLVDDDPEAADELSRAIGNWGHEVRWISDGSAAVPMAIAHRAEVALLDIALSGMSGYVVARELRREPGLRGCFLLAMRWRTDRRRDKQFREADIDMFLAKPLDLLVLETLLALERDRLAS
jgi:CheY-like chemotaxis protein